VSYSFLRSELRLEDVFCGTRMGVVPVAEGSPFTWAWREREVKITEASTVRLSSFLFMCNWFND